MTENSESRVNVRIDPDIRDRFYKKVASEGKTVTNVVLELIRQYLEDGQPESTNISDLENRIAELEGFKQRTEKLLNSMQQIFNKE